jgi:para-nitrobenzyl esterase
VVETASGHVRGESVGTVAGADGRVTIARFLGIPYAAPPVGDLRWRAPMPAVPWNETRDATAFAPIPPQVAAIESRLPGFRPDHPMSEDCLALNVWTPGRDGHRPVIVWLHGGGYLSGGTAQPVYDAARLAGEADAVVVTVGYRLGALGFLAPAGDAVANCGLRDQLAALAWVREHAATFGGDPARVTVMGESAGAGSVLHLLASPRGVGAFQRAVAQSGEPRTLSSDSAAEVAAALARALDCEPTATALRSAPVGRLLEAQGTVLVAMMGKLGPMAFAPSVDGDVCDGEIAAGLASGRGSAVDLVVGTTRDELALFTDPRAASLDDDRLLRRVGHLLGRESSAAIETYRAALGTDASNGAVWDAARTDAMMRVPNLRVADAHVAAGGWTFVYRFDWSAPGLGAAHGVDVPFTFGTADREGWAEIVGWDDRAEALGEEWRGSWASFAAVGDPGHRSRPWPSYDPVTRPTMVFGSGGAAVVDDPDGAPRSIWMA